MTLNDLLQSAKERFADNPINNFLNSKKTWVFPQKPTGGADMRLPAITKGVPTMKNLTLDQLREAQASASAKPTQQPLSGNAQQRYDQLLHGFGNYGATPSAEAVQVMAQAPDNYDVFAKFPALLPALSILETSAGQNITRPKGVDSPQNLMNWGIYTDYVPESQAASVDRAMTGIGERTPYYENFRKTGNLEDFVNTYAPASDGNEGYLQNLLKVMEYFQ